MPDFKKNKNMFKLLTFIILVGSTCKTQRQSSDSNTVKEYYSTGELKSVKVYKNKKVDWESITYFKNGKINSKASYHNERFIGPVTFYHSNGQKNFEQIYDSSGKSNGTFRLWNERGQIMQTGNDKQGKMIGEWKTYFDNGNLESIIQYNEGRKDGLSLLFNREGDTLKKEIYNLDSLIESK